MQDGSVVRHGVVAVVTRATRFLVIRRSRHVVAPGALCFPGGGIEPGESEEQALVRELREELGVEVEPGRLVWRSTTRWHVALAWWSARLADGASIAPNPAEVESVYWLEPEELLARTELLESNRAFFAALASGAIDLAAGQGPR